MIDLGTGNNNKMYVLVYGAHTYISLTVRNSLVIGLWITSRR